VTVFYYQLKFRPPIYVAFFRAMVIYILLSANVSPTYSSGLLQDVG